MPLEINFLESASDATFTFKGGGGADKYVKLKASPASGEAYDIQLLAFKLEDLQQELNKKLLALSNEAQSHEHISQIIKDPVFFSKFFTVEDEYKVLKSDWDDIADSVACGDAAWMLGSELLSAFFSIGSVTSFAANFIWPLALGTLVMARYYESAVERIRSEKGREPIAEELQCIKKETHVLGCKVFAAVVGWELGTELAQVICVSLVRAGVTAFAAYNPLAHLAAAALVGLFAGLGVVAVNVMNESNNGNFWKKETWQESGRLFLATFLAGAAWYGISLLPVAPVAKLLGPGFKSAAQPVAIVLMSLVKTALAYTAVRLAFSDVYKLSGGEGAKPKAYWGARFFSDAEHKSTAQAQTVEPSRGSGFSRT